jgi:hypothetical protein
MKSRRKLIGTKRVFNYPQEFTSLPDYSEHRGATVFVERELTPEEYDKMNGERMFQVSTVDGWRGQAWETELGKEIK